MSFRFNVDLSFDFPRPPPRNGQSQITATAPDPEGPEPRGKGLPGWTQTARQHPRYSLRLLYFVAAIIGLILNAIVVNSIWSWRIIDIANGAFGLLCIGLVWQFLNLFAIRIFRGWQFPNWLIAIIETLGFGAFLTVFVLENIAVEEQELDGKRYGYSSLEAVNLMKVAYNSSVWVMCCIVHAILAVQCYAQGVRNVRSKRAKCPDCEHARGEGNDVAGDEEEPLIGEAEGEGEGEAGPSQGTAVAPHRDE